MKEILKFSNHIEIIFDNTHLIVADHGMSRYIKVKKSSYLEFIEREMQVGIQKEKLIKKAEIVGLDINIVMKFISKFMEMGIITQVHYPEETLVNDSCECPEMLYDKRFGHEIEAFAFYETYGINRFQAFEMVRRGKVAIIGAGGVGSNIAVLLAAAGIAEITIVDGDFVEESNLVRQVFYQENDCGKIKKVTALKRFLEKFSTHTKIHSVDQYIKDIDDAKKYLKGVDVVIQTADTPRGVINRIINDYSETSKCASIYCANGTIGPFYIPGKTSSFRDLEKALNEESNGIYDLFVNIKKDENSRLAPSEVGGPWLAAYYLYSEIIDYFVGVQVLKTNSAIIRMVNKGFNVEILPISSIVQKYNETVTF